MVEPVSIFDSIKIPTIMYIILVFVAFLILLAGALLIFWIYHNGKSMKPFFWKRIQAWYDKGTSLFQVITLMQTIVYEDANYDERKGYEKTIPTIRIQEPLNKKKFYIALTLPILIISASLFIPTEYKPHSIIISILTFISIIPSLYIYFKRPTRIETINTERNQTPIIPTSSYTINGVDTVLLWDVHPKLPNYIKIGLETLINKNIITFKQFDELCNGKTDEYGVTIIKGKPNEILFDKYTNAEFLKMYLSYRNKFEVNVNVPIVYEFIGKNFDENYSESIQIKEYNAAYKTKNSDKFSKWGYIIVGIFVIGITFKVIYVTIY